MREADRRTIEDAGIPSITLMEHAGRQVAAAMATAFPDLTSLRVAVVSGRGNNGGDGFVVARVLRERGVDVSVVLIGRAADLTGDARTNFGRLGVAAREAPDEAAWRQASAGVLAADVIVDALVGTGLTAPLTGVMAAVVRDINAAGRRVVAIDLPSGLFADRSDIPGDAIAAALTVTLAAPKLPLVQPPAQALTGRLVVADIGIPRSVIDTLDGPRVEVLTRDAMAALVGQRRRDAHKGDYGHILVVAGSTGKTGAASLTAMAALRSGAGLVTVATPASCASVVAALGREYMTLGLEEGGAGDLAAGAVTQVLEFDADVLAIGPGLGRSPGVRALVRSLVERSPRPLVLDADALHAFAGDSGPLGARTGPSAILTPHPGEMAALTGLPIAEVQARRLDVARDFARANHVVVVLKGAWTVIAMPDGRAFINSTGNPGMATAGTGDVLTGAVAAWVAQVADAGAACSLAVYLHGLAGDLAAAEHGEVGLVAGDVLDRLGRAALDLTGAAARPSPL
jgi:NAD(P)H-hydrate epimerase